MLLTAQEYEHPTQASRLRLKLYHYTPPPQESVAGLLPDQPGYQLTEERVGTTTVVAGLGLFASEDQARERLAQRAHELAAQGWSLSPASP